MTIAHLQRCVAIGTIVSSSSFLVSFVAPAAVAQTEPSTTLESSITAEPNAASAPRTTSEASLASESCEGDYPRCPRFELWRLRTPNRSNPDTVQACSQGFAQLAPGSVLRSTSVCREGLTLPSLWWTQEQFSSQGRGYPEYSKLVQDWLTYLPEHNEAGRVDLVLELQRWSKMDYFKRYEFLSVFGTAAESFGYNLRALSFRGEFLGAYTCLATHAAAPQSSIDVEGSGAQEKPRNFLTQ
ncbi:MAG: hypothetical protein ACO3NK_19425 [Prochlorotrichaceae cyanobacterium]